MNFINWLKEGKLYIPDNSGNPILDIIQEHIVIYSWVRDTKLECSIKNSCKSLQDCNAVFYNDVDIKHDNISWDIFYSSQESMKEYLNSEVVSSLLHFSKIYQDEGAFWYGFHYNLPCNKYTFNYVNYSTNSSQDNEKLLSIARNNNIKSFHRLIELPYLVALQFQTDKILSMKVYTMFDLTISKIKEKYPLYYKLINHIFPWVSLWKFHILNRYTPYSNHVSKKIIFGLLEDNIYTISYYNIAIFISLWFQKELLISLFWVRIISIAFEGDNIELYFDFLYNKCKN